MGDPGHHGTPHPAALLGAPPRRRILPLAPSSSPSLTHHPLLAFDPRLDHYPRVLPPPLSLSLLHPRIYFVLLLYHNPDLVCLHGSLSHRNPRSPSPRRVKDDIFTKKK